MSHESDNYLMTTKRNDPMGEAIRLLRIGNHAFAAAIAAKVAKLTRPSEDLSLRLVTIQAEIADHDGEYKLADKLLRDHKYVSGDLKRLLRRKDDPFRFPRRNAAWFRLRQRLFYQWQRSVAAYRGDRFYQSKDLMDVALKIAEQLWPRSESLLTQLYYGAGKLAFHEGNFAKATELYRESIVNVSAGAATAEDREHYAAFARYSIAKALALGLGQCLREQGRLEDAYTVVVAGRMLFEFTEDRALTMYAEQLLASIERGTAGESNVRLLNSARSRLESCVKFFERRAGDDTFRSRYELALVLMQQDELAASRDLMKSVFLDASKKSNARPKWVANSLIGSSRIERRAKNFDAAVKAAEKAFGNADKELRKIAHRARGTWARALADQALNSVPHDPELLGKAAGKIDECLRDVARHDVRNRLTLTLWRALIRNAQGDRSGAESAFRDYDRSADEVDIGRVREFGEHVRSVLWPPVSDSGTPVDGKNPVYEMRTNLDAVRLHVVRRVNDIMHEATAAEKAKMIGISRSTFHRLDTKLKEITQRQQARVSAEK